MPFRFSRCLCLQTPSHDQAADFYHRVLGLPIADRQTDSIELSADPVHLFIDKGELKGPIFEFVVDDLVNARKTLEANGCTVVRWEGKGKACYMRDPFGFLFNLWEDRDAFK